MPRIAVVPGLSHTDHGIPPAVLDWALSALGEPTGFVLLSLDIPPELRGVPCGLYGPACGDAPVPDEAVTLAPRGGRAWPSRLLPGAPLRPSRQITVIAGPVEDHDELHDGLVLYTAYGGPVAPREPGDPSLANSAERETAAAFWAEHALSAP